jgi:ribosomal protein L32
MPKKHKWFARNYWQTQSKEIKNYRKQPKIIECPTCKELYLSNSRCVHCFYTETKETKETK